MAAMDDLLTIWDTEGVPAAAQDLMIAAGLLTVNKFAQIEDSAEKVRAFGLEDLGFKKCSRPSGKSPLRSAGGRLGRCQGVGQGRA